jgi:hypothetical protein
MVAGCLYVEMLGLLYSGSELEMKLEKGWRRVDDLGKWSSQTRQLPRHTGIETQGVRPFSAILSSASRQQHTSSGLTTNAILRQNVSLSSSPYDVVL